MGIGHGATGCPKVPLLCKERLDLILPFVSDCLRRQGVLIVSVLSGGTKPYRVQHARETRDDDASA